MAKRKLKKNTNEQKKKEETKLIRRLIIAALNGCLLTNDVTAEIKKDNERKKIYQWNSFDRHPFHFISLWQPPSLSLTVHPSALFPSLTLFSLCERKSIGCPVFSRIETYQNHYLLNSLNK